MFNVIRKLDQIFIGPFLWVARHCHKQERTLKDGHINNVLCIKLWGLGNLIVIAPLFDMLKSKYPDAHITLVTFDINKGILDRNKNLDQIIYFKFTTNIMRIIKQTFDLANKLRRMKIDVVINFETLNNAAAVFTCFINAPIRIGLINQQETTLYTHPVIHDQSQHISVVYSSLFKPLGIELPYQYAQFIIEDQEKQKVAAALRQKNIDRFVCIHAGSSINFRGKRLGEDRWGALANKIISKYDIGVVFTGTSEDFAMIERIGQKVTRKEKILNAAGMFSIRELMALMNRSLVFVSNDTGPAHLAASLRVNVAVLYGPSSPLRYGPLNENSLVFYKHCSCSPCIGVKHLNKECQEHFKCLDFDTQELFNGISEKFLDKLKIKR